MSAYAAYGRDLRMSQATPEPRNAGPESPIATASSPEITPMPTVRLNQIRFSDNTVSYSSRRFGKLL